MGEWLRKFMLGRNGADPYALFLILVSLVLLVAVTFIRGAIGAAITWLAYVILFYSLFRMLSRNVAKRRMENQGFLKLKAQIKTKFRREKQKAAQRKTYAFFSCPSCKAQLRVPRGKGRMRVTCPRCGKIFEARS